MRALPWLFAAFVVVALVPVGAAAAQDRTAPLTLTEALELAREHNPSYRQALNRVRAAAAEERQSWGAYLPDLSVSLSLSGGFSRVVTGADDTGQPFSLPAAREYNSSSTSQGVSLSYTLFDGFRRANQLQAARAGSRVASAAVDAEIVRVEAEVRRRFYRALSAERLVTVEERLLASAQERREATRELLRVASANPEDVLGAEVDVARQRQALERARGDARKQRLGLRESIGLDEDVAFRPGGELPVPFDPAALDADALVATALQASPRIRRLAALAEQAGHAADAARADRWPRIQASAGASRSFGLPNYDALTMLSPDNQQYRFGLSVSLPLFRGFQTSAQIQQAEVAQDNAGEQLRADRLAIEREVRSALIDVENAYRAVELADRAAELSRRRLEMAQERFRLGALTFTQLQFVIDSGAQAEREAVNARAEFARASTTLEEAVGREIQP